MKDEEFIVPVKFRDDRLLILDQTLLPGEEKYIELETKESVWDAILKLKVRGAPAIGVAAAYGLYISVRNSKADKLDEFGREIEAAADYLVTARPTAVNLAWALQRMKQRFASFCMVPDHEDDLLDNLNSLDVPETDLDPEAEFRLVNCSSELLEKILLRDNNRDDRVIELYKALICENIKEDWPDVTPDAILYYKEPDDEYFIIWDYVNAAGEQLTVNLDEELYEDLKTNYISAMRSS